VLGVDPDLGVALLAVKQLEGVSNFNTAASASVRPGSYVVAISREADGREQVIPGYVTSVLPPIHEQSGAIDFAVPFPDSVETAAVVNLDGDLVAITTETADGRTIIPADSLPGLIQRLADGPACQAIEVGDLDDNVRDLLDVKSGVFVERVREEAFLPEPSIRAGDVLIEWHGEPVSDAAQFAELYRGAEPGELVHYRALRNGRVVRGATRRPGPDCRPARPTVLLFPKLGLSLEWEQRGWKVVRVLADRPAASAGIEFGDTIVAVGGKSLAERESAPFEKYESDPQPMALTIRTGDRTRIVAVAPEEAEPGS
jgi:S1-C subfamily serine protease